MNKVQRLNLERIDWCCREQEITLDDLFAHLKISPRTLDALRSGEDALSPAQLRKIADFFQRGMLFFLERGSVDVNKVYTPQFRTLTNQKSHLSAKVRTIIERVERQRDIYLALQEEMHGAQPQPWHIEAPSFRDGAAIEQLAAQGREWLGLGAKNDFTKYRQAVEAKGLLVFVTNAYKGHWQIEKDSAVRGFSLHHPVCPVIVIKKQDSDAAQSFTLIHELGHLLLHNDSFIDDQEDFYNYRGREREANAFAGNLLVPSEFLQQLSLADFPISDVDAYDRYLLPYRSDWGISGEVILRRMLDEGLLPRTRYEAYRTRKSGNLLSPEQAAGGSRYRYREPLRMFGQPFVSTVLDALNAQKITLSRASTYLDNLKIADLRKLEASYAHA